MDVTSYLLGKKAGGGGDTPTGEINITTNGVANVKSYATANVNVQPILQSKSITITENGTQNVTADSGYDGLSNVSVTTNVSGGGGGGNTNNVFVDTTLQYDRVYGSGIRGIIRSIDNIDTSNMTDMNNMFNGCKHLLSIPTIDTSNVTNMSSMFAKCNIETIPLLNTSKVTNMSSMFLDCIHLQSIPLLNTSNVTNMSSMFNGCVKLETIPLLNTSNVTNMSSMFNNCKDIETIPLLNTSNVTNMNNMWSYCEKLTDQSLDNILQMCINGAINSNKTLARLGFSATYYPASRIQALPHYQDFINAGWTIGY